MVVTDQVSGESITSTSLVAESETPQAPLALQDSQWTSLSRETIMDLPCISETTPEWINALVSFGSKSMILVFIRPSAMNPINNRGKTSILVQGIL